jgi:hypothetical protein
LNKNKGGEREILQGPRDNFVTSSFAVAFSIPLDPGIWDVGYASG